MSPAIFGYVQKYMFTGQLVLDGESLPSYETLVAVWKAGYDLGIEGLGNKVLETMKKCRKLTQHVPSAQLIVRVWKDTPEGSSIRDLILSWTAEYLRASELRAEFAKALPQEALSELVVMMSKLPAVAATSPAAGPTPALHVNDPSTPAAGGRSRSGYHQAAVGNGSGLRRSIQQMQKPNPAAASGAHGQLAGTGAETSSSHRNKKMRLSGPGPSPANDSGDTKPPRKKPGPKPGFRAAMKAAATARRRESGLMAAPAGEGSGGGVSLETREFTDAQKVEFCADLLLRMMSGPGMASLPRFLLDMQCDFVIADKRALRLLDETGSSLQGSRRSRARWRARLLRKGPETNGPWNYQEENGPGRV